MKTILVTGANGGIGNAVVNRLLDDGCFVFGLDVTPPKTERPNYRHLIAGVTDQNSLDQALLQVQNETDRLDAIINVAGAMFFGSLIEQPSDYLETALQVNVVGTCRVNKTFFPLVEKAKGRIINFSSEYGTYTTVPFNAFYTASKHALESYNDGLRRELNYLGIKVIAFRPGAINTSMTASTTNQFESICQTTNHYLAVYEKLKPLMTNGTKNALAPQKLAQTVSKAVFCKRPKKVYKVNQDPLVKLLSLFSPRFVDWLFLHLFK